MSKDIVLYDTTLRDGCQAEDISFTVEDKVRITKRLDELGIHYIEGGWPGSNPKDIKFFKEMRSVELAHAKLVAFGSTARPPLTVTGRIGNPVSIAVTNPPFLNVCSRPSRERVPSAKKIKLAPLGSRAVPFLSVSMVCARSDRSMKMFFDA